MFVGFHRMTQADEPLNIRFQRVDHCCSVFLMLGAVELFLTRMGGTFDDGLDSTDALEDIICVTC